MSSDDQREARRLKILQKLNNKYKDSHSDETDSSDPIKTNEFTPSAQEARDNTQIESNNQPQILNAASIQSQSAGKQLSAFDEYKKLKETEIFEVLFFFTSYQNRKTYLKSEHFVSCYLDC